MTKKKKELFEVAEGESIDACLERIKLEGYFPVKRTEKPIFKENIEAGEVRYEPVMKKIVFEAKLIE